MSYVIKNENGTYYTGMTGIGPKFGGTVQEAMKFENIFNSAKEMQKHSFAFSLCKVEEIPIKGRHDGKS